MQRHYFLTCLYALAFSFTLSGTVFAQATSGKSQLTISFDTASKRIQFGVSCLEKALEEAGQYFSVRELNVNLPCSLYRLGPAMDVHKAVCRNLVYWQRMLDQMAENRFNILLIWNVHPFACMVKPTNFPEANSFSPTEMADWMSNFSGTNASRPEMSPKDREDWIEETVVAGIKAAMRIVKRFFWAYSPYIGL